MANIRIAPFARVVSLFLLLLGQDSYRTAAWANPPTALDDYIAQRDPTFQWQVAGKLPSDSCTAYVLELTSQTWRSATEVDRPTWKHWLTVVRPKKVTHQTAFLVIGGGSNRDPAPDKVEPRLVRLADGHIVGDEDVRAAA